MTRLRSFPQFLASRPEKRDPANKKRKHDADADADAGDGDATAGASGGASALFYPPPEH